MIITWIASWKKLFKAEQVTFIWLRLTATLILAMSNSNIYIKSTMLIRSLYYIFHQNILPILDCWSCFPSTLLNSNKVLEDQNIHVITILWILLTTSKTSLKILLCSLSGNTWGAGSWTPSTVQRISDGGFEASLWAEILIDLVPYDHHSIILALLSFFDNYLEKKSLRWAGEFQGCPDLSSIWPIDMHTFSRNCKKHNCDNHDVKEPIFG